MAAPSKAETELRVNALDYAVRCAPAPGDVVELATSFYAFLSGVDSSTSTQRTSTSAKADAPATATDSASSQSSDKPAVSTAASTAEEKPKEAASSTTTSPSEPADGFDPDGNVITKDDVVKVAMKYTQAFGQPKFVEKLAEYGAPNISGIDASKYAEFVAKLNGELALA